MSLIRQVTDLIKLGQVAGNELQGTLCRSTAVSSAGGYIDLDAPGRQGGGDWNDRAPELLKPAKGYH